MISKQESISPNTLQASRADLERNLGSLSLRYKRQSIELPFNHEKQTTLARLYSAANMLHRAVREGMVASAVFEIGSNLIGCEQIALLVMHKRKNGVEFIGSAEFSPQQLDSLRRHAKRIIEEAPEELIFSKTAGKDKSLASLGLSARIPFRLDDTAKGAIVFFDLLPQRNGLDAGDQELLKLLGTYTGLCLAANKTKQQETLGWVQL